MFAPSSKKVSARRLWLASLKPSGRTSRSPLTTRNGLSPVRLQASEKSAQQHPLTNDKEIHTMIQEVLVGGEKALLVHTEEEFQEAFGRGETILPATMALARKMGCPEQEEGHEPAEAEHIK